MKTHSFFCASRLTACALAFIGLLFAPQVAQAQAVEGCNNTIMEAMQAKAQAKVAYDVAVTEQIVDKPDSVLAMTCFNKSAGVSAEKGGEIFSGSLLSNSDFNAVIGDSLTAMYDDFGGAHGEASGTVTYDATLSAADSDCDGISDLWDRIEQDSISDNVPYVSMEEMMAGTLPTGVDATSAFAKNWDSTVTEGHFTDLETKVDNVNALKPTIPTFAPTDNVCQVLEKAGAVASCP